MRASIKPLTAAAASAALVAAVPIMMTTLLAERSNRPEIGFDSAAGGSLHPVHLLQFAFADLFGAMDPSVEYWAPQSLIWDAEWGWPGLYLSQNMGLVYAGALTLVACRCRSASFAASPGRARFASSPSPRGCCCSTRSVPIRRPFT
jgi:hypothetical protein